VGQNVACHASREGAERGEGDSERILQLQRKTSRRGGRGTPQGCQGDRPSQGRGIRHMKPGKGAEVGDVGRSPTERRGVVISITRGVEGAERARSPIHCLYYLGCFSINALRLFIPYGIHC